MLAACAACALVVLTVGQAGCGRIGFDPIVGDIPGSLPDPDSGSDDATRPNVLGEPLGHNRGPANPTVCDLSTPIAVIEDDVGVVWQAKTRTIDGSAVDFDRDGNPDAVFAVENLGPSASVYFLGNGDGTFTGYDLEDCDPDFEGNFAWSVEIADLNHDGYHDLILGSWLQGTCNDTGLDHNRIFYGNGDGTFQSPVAMPRHPNRSPQSGRCNDSLLENTRDYATGDSNGDGLVDLIAAADTSVTRVWSVENGVVTPLDIDLGSGDHFAVELGDLDRDGNLDLVIGGSREDSKIYRGTGGGDFDPTPTVFASSSGDAEQFIMIDVNGDGSLDIIEASTSEVVFLKGNGSGGFVSSTVIANREGTIATGDFNGDCLTDVAIGIDAGVNQQIILAENSGSASCEGAVFAGFGAPIDLAIAGWFRGIATSDVDLDGRDDILLGGSGQSGAIFLSDL